MERLSTVICVFLDWNEIRRQFVENLRACGTAVKVIILRDNACSMDPEGATVIGKSEFDRGIDEM
jgi:hypothetical protein